MYYHNLTELFESQVSHGADGPTPVAENELPLTEISTISTFTPGPGTPAESDPSAESPDIQKCQEFVQNTCGCHLAQCRPCSNLFSLEHYIQLRAQSSFLTRDELDLTLIGSIMSTLIQDDYVRDGRHKNPKRRKQMTTLYMHHGYEICKKTFTFLYGIGKERLRNVRDSYLTNGLETRVHGNTKRLPHNHLTHAVITNVTKFLKNYSEENAILLPGRIPGHKRDDIRLLPSSRSKKVSPRIRENKHCLTTCQHMKHYAKHH